MLYIRGHKIIKGYIGNTPISHVGFGESGLIKIESENGDSDYPDNLIAVYTANVSGVLPTFNSGYQYTVNETESNGIYTVELFSDDDFTSCSFNGKAELLTVDYLKFTNKATSMYQMFKNCSKLTNINLSNFDTSNVSSMYTAFQNCLILTTLDVSNFDTSKVTNMSYMFSGCKSLTQLDVSNFDGSNVTNTSAMFYNCTGLTQLNASISNISKLTNISYMFGGCTALPQLDVSSLNTSKVTNITGFITKTNALQDFISCVIPLSFEADSTSLTHDSLMSIINNLATVTTTQTLTLGSTNLAKLTAEEIAIATNKGWTVV